MEKLKQNKNDLRLFKKDNLNFKSENTFSSLNQPLKPKIQASDKEFSTISYREDNTDHRTNTEENSEISSLLHNIKNLKTEENKRNAMLNNNFNYKNNSQSFHTISNTNRSLVSNNTAGNNNHIRDNNNNYSSVNVNSLLNNNLNNNYLEIIVEQSDTIRCSSQNNTATLASMGLTNKKNAYDEIFMATNNSKINKSITKNNNYAAEENNNYRNNNGANNPFYFKNHLNTQREILFGKKDYDGQISEKDLLDEFTVERKSNDYNKSIDMNNLQNLKNFQAAAAEESSNNNENSNLLFNENVLNNRDQKNKNSLKNANEKNLKNNNYFAKDNINNNNYPDTDRNHQELESVIRNKLLHKNRISQNSIIKSTFDIKKSDSNLNFNLNNSCENSHLNARNNDFINDYEISGKYINNNSEANIPSASNNNFRINKSSNIVNNNLLINNNFFIENKNFVNNQISNCVIIESKNPLIVEENDKFNNINNNHNEDLKNTIIADKVLNKNSFVQSKKDKMIKNSSKSNISCLQMLSNSVISDLNPFTNRTLTNRENNNTNFNTLISKNNIDDNLTGNTINNPLVLNERDSREKTLSTKNANASNHNFSTNLNNNTKCHVNNLRSNKSNSINLNHTKEITSNKVLNLNSKSIHNNQLVNLKNENSSNNKDNRDNKTNNNNKEGQTLLHNDRLKNNQAQKLHRKGSEENEKSSNGEEKPKLAKEEADLKTEQNIGML